MTQTLNYSVLCIVVTYNAMSWISRCLNSVNLSTKPVKVFVIDNGSTDGTQDYLKHHNIDYFQSQENLGFGRANNIGLQKALDEGYDYVYLLNQDAWLFPDTINTLVDIHQKHSEYGVLSPMQLQVNERHFDQNFLYNVIGTAQTGRERLEEGLFFHNLSDVYEVNFVMAAHWLISRQCLEKVGGFSPTFPHYGEDDNYLQRCQYWGMKVGIVPSAKAVHDRANRKYTEEKHQYIVRYIEALKRASQPVNPVHIDKYIKAYIRGGILGRDKYMCKYACRLYRERKVILINREISMSQHTAFLKVSNHD